MNSALQLHCSGAGPEGALGRLESLVAEYSKSRDQSVR